MTKPVPGHETIGTPYGKPGSWAAGYHTGNDYPAPSGATVVATRAGKVTKAQYDGDYGNRIEILTGDIEHSYSHLSKMAVSVGQQVGEGQKIGEVGSTGNSTGPHVHYEERHPPHGYSDDRKPQFDTSSSGGGGGDPWASGDVYLSKLRYGSNGDAGEGSDSVRRLQTVLNAHSLAAPGNITLPVTGGYFDLTDQVVRADQDQHLPPSDPPGASFVGSGQAAHLFGPSYRVIDDR